MTESVIQFLFFIEVFEGIVRVQINVTCAYLSFFANSLIVIRQKSSTVFALISSSCSCMSDVAVYSSSLAFFSKPFCWYSSFVFKRDLYVSKPKLNQQLQSVNSATIRLGYAFIFVETLGLVTIKMKIPRSINKVQKNRMGVNSK